MVGFFRAWLTDRGLSGSQTELLRLPLFRSGTLSNGWLIWRGRSGVDGREGMAPFRHCTVARFKT